MILQKKSPNVTLTRYTCRAILGKWTFTLLKLFPMGRSAGTQLYTSMCATRLVLLCVFARTVTGIRNSEIGRDICCSDSCHAQDWKLGEICGLDLSGI